MPKVTSFDQLVALALDAPFSGWDFSWLNARATSAPLPWSYAGEVGSREIPEYSVERFRPQLRTAFETKSLWPLPFRQPRFLVVAIR
jgi:hypothetical protein